MLPIQIGFKKNFLNKHEADYLLKIFDNNPPPDNLIKYEQYLPRPNKTLKLKRMMAYYSRKGEDYEYAGLKLQGHNWEVLPKEFFDLHNWICEYVDSGKVNSVLFNLYRDGKDEIRWHSDKESQLVKDSPICCVNLGATRKFWFLEKDTGNKFFIDVGHGDLLVMRADCQEKYLHAILKEKEITETRISLTFREVYD